MDPLWGGDDESTQNMRTFWWEPFWVSVAFWDKQMDLPFREDRCIFFLFQHRKRLLIKFLIQVYRASQDARDTDAGLTGARCRFEHRGSILGPTIRLGGCTLGKRKCATHKVGSGTV
jgi:hypothetical protein